MIVYLNCGAEKRGAWSWRRSVSVRMSASTSRGSGAGNGVPAAARKLVQSLKEIVVGCSDAEIYVVLKECNMDADEAVNRLLSQGMLLFSACAC